MEERIRKCPECGSKNLVTDYRYAELYCADCGVVIDEDIAPIKFRNIYSQSYPLRQDLGELGRLLNKMCDNKENFRPITKDVKEGARQILQSVIRHYPTQGRRLSVIVLASLGLARRDDDISDLQDLVHRAEYMLGEKIPYGQIRNTFHELRTFLRLRHLYKESKGVSHVKPNRENNGNSLTFRIGRSL